MNVLAAKTPGGTEGSAEAELVRRVQSGDREAFGELVHRYTGKLYAISMSMLRNEQDARENVQASFLNAWRGITNYRGDSSIGSWLGKIASNNALMRLRTRRRKPESPLDPVGPGFDGEGHHERPVVDWSPLADKLREDKELGEGIRRAVEALPESYRTVVVLADYQEMSMKEIAEILDISVPNVKTRLHRARLALREALDSYINEHKLVKNGHGGGR